MNSTLLVEGTTDKITLTTINITSDFSYAYASFNFNAQRHKIDHSNCYRKTNIHDGSAVGSQSTRAHDREISPDLWSRIGINITIFNENPPQHTAILAYTPLFLAMSSCLVPDNFPTNEKLGLSGRKRELRNVCIRIRTSNFTSAVAHLSLARNLIQSQCPPNLSGGASSRVPDEAASPPEAPSAAFHVPYAPDRSRRPRPTPMAA